jgi:hypothetical protein
MTKESAETVIGSPPCLVLAEILSKEKPTLGIAVILTKEPGAAVQQSGESEPPVRGRTSILNTEGGRGAEREK